MARIQQFLISPCTVIVDGPGSSVGIATDYGLDGPGIELDVRHFDI
jgi:hypothetical protein